MAAIKAAVATIQAKLPFLVTLTAAERKATYKTGPNSLSFVENAQQAAVDNPGILPASFNTVEFTGDVKLLAVLTAINTMVAQVASSIDDTRLAAGGEAMQEAVQVYN